MDDLFRLNFSSCALLGFCETEKIPGGKLTAKLKTIFSDYNDLSVTGFCLVQSCPQVTCTMHQTDTPGKLPDMLG